MLNLEPEEIELLDGLLHMKSLDSNTTGRKLELILGLIRKIEALPNNPNVDEFMKRFNSQESSDRLDSILKKTQQMIDLLDKRNEKAP